MHKTNFCVAGEIMELLEFGAGNAVVLDYTTDFVLPTDYPVQLNQSPDIDDRSGKWTGKSIEAGTYVIGLTGYRDKEARMPTDPLARLTASGNGGTVGEETDGATAIEVICCRMVPAG